MLQHYLAKQKTRKCIFSRKCFMLICQYTHKSQRNYHLITVRLLFIHKTIGIVHQTKPRKGTRHSATCFAIRTNLMITISVMVSGRLGTRPMSRIEVFPHQVRIACQWIALLRCFTILTKC